MAVYLNTYETFQSYGGPEEGGWWYECGTPVQSIFISSDDYEEWIEKTPQEERDKLREKTTLTYTQGKAPVPIKNGFGGYTFMPGSDDPVSYRQENSFNSMFEESFAQEYPQERPYYC